jgi:hypothetical protein
VIHIYGAGSRVPEALVHKVGTLPSSLNTKADPMYKTLLTLFIYKKVDNIQTVSKDNITPLSQTFAATFKRYLILFSV